MSSIGGKEVGIFLTNSFLFGEYLDDAGSGAATQRRPYVRSLGMV